jgi:putative transposase
LAQVTRSSVYYQPKGETQMNLTLMRRIDELYTKCPFYGSRKLTALLRKECHLVNRKRVSRLMNAMGIEAIYQKPRTTKPAPEDKKYPYLLREREISSPGQVWCADITYIRLYRGFVYLVAVMDWFSRYVLSWRLSNSMETSFCLDALQEALERFCAPGIFNTDQGSQFTSGDFTGCLEGAGVDISMDGRGRYLDNIFIERLWRSVKYEEVYLKDYQTMRDASSNLGSYFGLYNNERPHQSLDYQTPAEVYMMG